MPRGCELGGHGYEACNNNEIVMATIHNFPDQSKEKRDFWSLPSVVAPSPTDPSVFVELQVSGSTTEKLVQARRATDMFQAWAHLVGETPPVNNADLIRKTQHPNIEIACLRAAHACFKGVNRRYDGDDTGGEIYVYVIKTDYTVRWQSSLTTTVGFFSSPPNTLLTVQVRFNDSLQADDKGISGEIVKWEFVKADESEKNFPTGFGDRYDTLLWPE